MKTLALLWLLAIGLAGCATDYQPQGFTGGYSDYLTAPDEAVVTFHGNGYTPAERVVQMAALRCADVTLVHGYRYFVLMSVADLNGTTSFTTPGYAHTTGYANAFGNFATGSATTVITPPQTHTSNNQNELQGIGLFLNGQRARPKDAAFLAQSLRQYLEINPSS